MGILRARQRLLTSPNVSYCSDRSLPSIFSDSQHLDDINSALTQTPGHENLTEA